MTPIYTAFLVGSFVGAALAISIAYLVGLYRDSRPPADVIDLAPARLRAKLRDDLAGKLPRDRVVRR